MSSREFDVWAWRETRWGPRRAAPARDAAAVPLWVAEQKTGKRRIVGLPEHLLRDIRKIAGKKYVFEHKNDPERHRTRQAVWKDVKRAAVAFRLPQNVAPHSVRKVYAVDLMLSFSCGHCTRNLFVEVWGTPKYQSRAATTNRARNAAKL